MIQCSRSRNANTAPAIIFQIACPGQERRDARAHRGKSSRERVNYEREEKSPSEASEGEGTMGAMPNFPRQILVGRRVRLLHLREKRWRPSPTVLLPSSNSTRSVHMARCM